MFKEIEKEKEEYSGPPLVCDGCLALVTLAQDAYVVSISTSHVQS